MAHRLWITTEQWFQNSAPAEPECSASLTEEFRH